MCVHTNGLSVCFTTSFRGAELVDQQLSASCKWLQLIIIIIIAFCSFIRVKNAAGRTVFENHRQSLIQHCERSELRLHLINKAKNCPIWWVFENLKLAVKQCYQVSFYKTKLCEKCQNSNATFWVIFKQCAQLKFLWGIFTRFFNVFQYDST